MLNKVKQSRPIQFGVLIFVFLLSYFFIPHSENSFLWRLPPLLKDVPREKVLKIESIMDPVDTSSSQSLTISRHAIIETVAESILNSKEILTVIDPNNNNDAVGSLNPSKVVKVLFGDSKTNN